MFRSFTEFCDSLFLTQWKKYSETNLLLWVTFLVKRSTLPIVLLKFSATYFGENTRFFTFETFTKDSSRLSPTNFSHETKNTTVGSGHIYSTLFLLFRGLSGGSVVSAAANRRPRPHGTRQQCPPAARAADVPGRWAQIFHCTPTCIVSLFIILGRDV